MMSVGEVAWVPDPDFSAEVSAVPEDVIEVPREVKVATEAGINAYLACQRAGLPPDVAIQFAGVAFKATIEMAENERDRGAQLYAATLPFQGGAKKVG